MNTFSPNIFIHAANVLLLIAYIEAGNVIETHEHTGDFKEW